MVQKEMMKEMLSRISNDQDWLADKMLKDLLEHRELFLKFLDDFQIDPVSAKELVAQYNDVATLFNQFAVFLAREFPKKLLVPTVFIITSVSENSCEDSGDLGEEYFEEDPEDRKRFESGDETMN